MFVLGLLLQLLFIVKMTGQLLAMKTNQMFTELIQHSVPPTPNVNGSVLQPHHSIVKLKILVSLLRMIVVHQ